MNASPSSRSTLSSSVHRLASWPWLPTAALAGVFFVAFAARLIPILRRGGLHEMGNYDDGVHYAAAMGLVHGLLPYRDFLLLHPPGIVLLLAPFAWLADVLGEPNALAVARLCWMALGALNAVLCALVLLPQGRRAAVIAGLLYALFFGGIYIEHTVLLEAPATTVLLLALVLTRALGSGEGVPTANYIAAGLLLGLSPAVKIWGVVAVAVVAGGLAWRRGRRRGLTVLLSATASCTIACLPFFLAAPRAMWQMVVADQLGRRRDPLNLVERVDDMLGLSLWTTGQPRLHLGTALMIILVLASLLSCVLSVELRLLAALLITHVSLLAVTPVWFQHYSGLLAAPLVLVLGAGLAVAIDKVGTVRPWLPAALASLATVAVLVSALPITQLRLGRTFPSQAAAAILADVPGCIVTDFPMTLIQTNLLRRNLERGCRFEVDLGGASYDLDAGADKEKPRHRNRVWQRYALDYLRSGDAAIIAKFTSNVGFSHKTAKEVHGWPELDRFGRYRIVVPQPKQWSNDQLAGPAN